MYGLSLGVQQMSEILPLPVYALLSGLNSSTVGLIALAAVQLAEKAIKDKTTRILVVFGACAGVCYNALWYFPVLMVIGGFTTFLWDGYLGPWIARFRARRRRRSSPDGFAEDTAEPSTIEGSNSIALEATSSSQGVVQRRTNASSSKQPAETDNNALSENTSQGLPEAPTRKDHTIRVWVGVPVVVGFFGMYSN